MTPTPLTPCPAVKARIGRHVNGHDFEDWEMRSEPVPDTLLNRFPLLKGSLTQIFITSRTIIMPCLTSGRDRNLSWIQEHCFVKDFTNVWNVWMCYEGPIKGLPKIGYNESAFPLKGDENVEILKTMLMKALWRSNVGKGVMLKYLTIQIAKLLNMNMIWRFNVGQVQIKSQPKCFNY